MSFLSGLGSFAGGAAQGLDQGSLIRQRATQIQAAQFALDQAKKDVAAQAAAFGGLTGGNQTPAAAQGPNLSALPGPQMAPPPAAGPQPMPPGQPSVPSQPQAAPQAPPLQQAPQAVLQAPGAPNPSGGQPQAPSPSPQPGGGAPANTSQIDPTDPQAGVKVVEMIARQIKSANPNVDPQTLLLATQRVIDMSKGMAPQLRAGAQVVVEQLRSASQERNTDVRAQTSTENNLRTTQTSAGNTDKRTASQEKIAAGHDQAGLERTAATIKGAMDRVQAVQSAATGRANMSSRDKAVAERVKMVTSELNDATKRLAQLKNNVTGTLDDNDPRVQAINKQVQSATAKLEMLEKATNVKPASAGGGTDDAPTATNAKGEKLKWDGKNWVPANSGATK